MKNETGASEAEVHGEQIERKTAGCNFWRGADTLTPELCNDLEMNLGLGNMNLEVWKTLY